MMLDLFGRINKFLTRMKVHRGSGLVSEELKDVIVSFFATLLDAITVVTRFMKTHPSSAYFLFFSDLLFTYRPPLPVSFSYPYQDILEFL